MHNSLLASSHSCHSLKPENTYSYFSDLRNKPALSGSNSFPEEKQPCQDLVVYCCVGNIKDPIYTQLRGFWSWGSARALYPWRSAVWNDEHAAACGEGHRRNRRPYLHQTQAEPAEITHPAAARLNITKWTQDDRLS